jgi:hypothetical protein
MSSRIPWPRVLTEGAMIVVSILLALTLDAWWDTRQEADREERVMESLFAESQTNLTRLDANVAWRTGIDEATDAILAAAAVGANSISSDSLDHLLGSVSWWGGAGELEMSAVNAVVSAGDLTLIRNDELRLAVTDWQRRVVNAERNEAQDYDWFFDVWMPYLRSNTNLPQVSNAIDYLPGGTDPTYGRPAPVGASSDHRPLLSDADLVNVTLQRRWINDDMLFQYGQLREGLSHLTLLLERELLR